MPGESGRDGLDGAKGDMGPHGPPGRKVSDATKKPEFTMTKFVQGDRGFKGEPGFVPKFEFNSTHLIMMGPPGAPGPKVK